MNVDNQNIFQLLNYQRPQHLLMSFRKLSEHFIKKTFLFLYISIFDRIFLLQPSWNDSRSICSYLDNHLPNFRWLRLRSSADGKEVRYEICNWTAEILAAKLVYGILGHGSRIVIKQCVVCCVRLLDDVMFEWWSGTFKFNTWLRFLAEDYFQFSIYH